MADLNFILQAVTTANHADALRALLQLQNPSQILISVAFARTTGLNAIQDELKPLIGKTKFFVGIRNDITSIQAVKQLLALKLELYAVDTGSRKTIFHPKVYLASNATDAIAIVGSANMTFSGLHNNIEVSTRIALDLTKKSDKTYVDSVIDAFDTMSANHPKHVFKITDEKHASLLFKQGRLADERVVVAPVAVSSIKEIDRDDLAPMILTRVKSTSLPKSKETSNKTVISDKSTQKKSATTVSKPVIGTKYLVWKSKPLSERDLNIPVGPTTKRTGSMGLKKGLYEDIDHRHYFYEVVFNSLIWEPDASPSKKFRATTKFELVIKNVNYGIFDLVVSHDTDTTTRSYQQSNMMTHLHWGTAKGLIAKQDLLGRNLYLYRKDSSPPEFMIEID